jgi:ATP-dependent Clp protease ATP-binding subunit ClpC
VTEEDIAQIASKWTGIPVTRMTETETQKLQHMEGELHKRLIGQDEAVKIVSQAIKRSRTGMKDPKRPIGNFIFLGPTGVGKTELARVLADFMFGNEEAMVRIDMSEYMEKFSVSRLIGAPPGYVGYEEGGKLTELVRRKPYSVVVLDEIEKAHPDVFNILLQIMDEGTLTDSLGHKVSFKNAILIMTSNVGARLISKGKTLGFMPADDKEKDYKEMKDTVMDEVKRVFNPEFINRIDEVIVFRPLTEADTEKILELSLVKVDKKLEAKGVKFTITQAAKTFLVKKGFDPNYGARPLIRTVQKYLEDPMAEFLLNSTMKQGDVVKVDYKGEGDALELKVQ